jgi:hypothetical protein
MIHPVGKLKQDNLQLKFSLTRVEPLASSHDQRLCELLSSIVVRPRPFVRPSYVINFSDESYISQKNTE